MSTLDTAVHRVKRSLNEKSLVERDELIACLQGIVNAYQKAIEIWQDYIIKNPPLIGSRWVISNWIGEERARKLWAINRKITHQFEEIAKLTNVELVWNFPIDETMVSVADRQLVEMPNTEGIQAAKVAIMAIKERLEHVRRLLEQLELD